VKRIFDCTAVLAALFLFGLPMLLAALLVKLTSPGPVLYAGGECQPLIIRGLLRVLAMTGKDLCNDPQYSSLTKGQIDA